jgi:ABC-type Fe3+ transport system permease subunit
LLGCCLLFCLVVLFALFIRAFTMNHWIVHGYSNHDPQTVTHHCNHKKRSINTSTHGHITHQHIDTSTHIDTLIQSAH